MKHLELWNKLYELIDQWNQFKPWEHIYSNELICIEFADEDPYYISIMGKLGDCIAVSIYQGEKGYADICSISHEYNMPSVTSYVMFEQSCLTYYLGDRNEVPQEQKNMMKKLNKKYRGNGHWPYFLSFIPQFYPYQINDEEAKTFIKVFEQLIPLMNEYILQHIDVLFDENEMIYAHVVDQQWVYEAMSRPDEIDKYYPIELTDKHILQKLVSLPKTHHRYIFDLCYNHQGYIDDQYERPLHGLLLLMLDYDSQMIMNCQLLSPEHDEIQECILMFCEMIEKMGKPETVFIRNPTIFSAIKDICDACHIEIILTELYMVDDIVDEMTHLM